jgi:hypothetical protein
MLSLFFFFFIKLKGKKWQMLMGGGTVEGGEAVVMHCNGWRGE